MGITTAINSLFKKIQKISCYLRFLESYLLNVKYFKEVNDKIFDKYIVESCEECYDDEDLEIFEENTKLLPRGAEIIIHSTGECFEKLEPTFI